MIQRRRFIRDVYFRRHCHQHEGKLETDTNHGAAIATLREVAR